MDDFTLNETPAQLAADVHELASVARDWQRQFHELATEIEMHGFRVDYDDKGKPVVVLMGRPPYAAL